MPPEKAQDSVGKLIDELLSQRGKSITPEDMGGFLDALMSFISERENGLSAKIDGNHSTAGAWFLKLSTEQKAAIEDFKTKLAQEVERVSSRIPTLPDRTPIWERIDEVERKIPTVPEEHTAEDIRNMLEALPTGDKLAIEAIEGLRKELDALKKGAVTGGGGGIVGRDIIKDYDLSAQLDGATKTFNLPAIWNIISVDTSSFPHALRKGVDYTWTPTSITFTSEIDAASTLAAGQTVVLTIVTA
jgi:hypothetical protein